MKSLNFWIVNLKIPRGNHLERLRIFLAYLLIAIIITSFIIIVPQFVSRTIVLTANTSVLRVVFDEGKNWRFDEGVQLCIPFADPRRAIGHSDPQCRQFQRSEEVYRHLAIGSGDEIEVRLESGGELLVRFLPCRDTGGHQCNIREDREGTISPRNFPNAFLFVPQDRMEQAGPLHISGNITIGRDIGTGGSTSFLKDGNYEFREQNLLNQAFGRRSVVVERGSMIAGSEVNIKNGSQGFARSNGYFYWGVVDNQPSLRTVSISETGSVSLLMTLSGAQPIEIDPDFIDSLIANPVFVAIALLIGMLLNALQLISRLMGNLSDP